MSGTKISALPAAAALSGTEPVPVVQAGATVKTTTAAIAGLASSPNGANPTATVGAAAVNGAASTFLRSDGAPPLAAGNAIAGPRSLVYAIGQITTQHSHTGDTNETKVGSIAIPANLIGANGTLRITSVWSRNIGGTSNVIYTVYFSATNDLLGTFYTQAVMTTGFHSAFGLTIVTNRNAINSQVGPSNTQAGPGGGNTGSPTTSGIDTTAQTFVVFSILNVNSGDTGSLEQVTVEFIPAGGN